MEDTITQDERAGLSVIHVAEDAATASESSLEQVAKKCEAKGNPIRMRLPIQLWDGAQYVSYRGQIWKVEAADSNEVRKVTEALGLFFDLLAKGGVDAMIAGLKAGMAVHDGGAD